MLLFELCQVTIQHPDEVIKFISVWSGRRYKFIHYKVGDDKKDIHQAGWFLRKTLLKLTQDFSASAAPTLTILSLICLICPSQVPQL